ncbi:MAG TPA: cytochrome c oxidase accessory protein CcoG [Cytophagaceae bacterium]
MEAIRENKVSDFRDHIATADKDGKRIWVYPKKPKGRLTNYRNWVSYVFLILFFTMPFMKINGQPLLLLNFPERKFILFGAIFWPQDFHLFLIGTLAFMVFIVLFTIIYGRVFCGWVCPQTIFMEMVFRKIEYFIEGDYKSQMALNKAPMSWPKFAKKASKHVIFFTISFIISNTFLTYIIGVDEWWKIVTDPIGQHIAGIVSITIFTGVFYWVYAWFREQVCTAVCPYGRLQGVLLDRDSIVVAYDYVRGESRGKIRKNENRAAAGKGDCIDCNQCVNVCPTGIDIRNGTQLECINCTACIDACDFMMEKVGLKKGLIRYASENSIANKKPFHITRKIKGYTAVLGILVMSFAFLLGTRSEVETSILRTPGTLYQELEKGKIGNLYNVKIVNKTNEAKDITLKILDGHGQIRMVGKDLFLESQSIASGALFVVMDRNEISDTKTKVVIGVYSNGKLLEKVNTNFIGPIN